MNYQNTQDEKNDIECLKKLNESQMEIKVQLEKIALMEENIQQLKKIISLLEKLQE